MNIEPQQVLCSLIEDYGRDLILDQRKLRALLSDLCGNFKAENYVLEIAIEEGIIDELIAVSDDAYLTTVMPRLHRRLETNRGVSEELARWAVESWALALKLPVKIEQASYVPHTPDRDTAVADEEVEDPVEPYVRGKLRSTGNVHELYWRLTLLA